MPGSVGLIKPEVLPTSVARALSRVTAALEERGFDTVEISSSDRPAVPRLLVLDLMRGDVSEKLGLASAEPQAEALQIAHCEIEGVPSLAVLGGDARGLMYALYEIAACVGAAEGKDPFEKVAEVNEAPFCPERSLSIYTMQKQHFEDRLFDPEYWDRYLEMLARNRFNTFSLLLAYESAGYMAPPYPYFFDIPGYPDVHVIGLPDGRQAKSLVALNRLIDQVHDHGLDFTLGIWDHIYRGGVQQGPGPDVELPWRVKGVTAENLNDFTVAGLKRLLELVPDIDTLQFRMHGESGLKKEEMHGFWDRMYDVIRDHPRRIRFDARAKGFPDSLVDLALSKGIEFRICTKYWMEQMGLPFHPTHVHPTNQHDRRHSYADLLRYPRRYPMVWRLWNGGTSRVFLWGDPDYVRRFAGSTKLYDGSGFDVNEPLATKMASQDHDEQPFDLLAPEFRHFEHEFERYWHFYELFGRLGYNPEASPDLWMRSFVARFGGEVGPKLMSAVHAASRVLPMAVAYAYPYQRFPTTRGWIERQRMEDLPEWSHALPSDTQQFQSFGEAADHYLSDTADARRHPLRMGVWFENLSAEIGKLADSAEAAGDAADDPELRMTLVDVRALSHIAKYHASRARSGFWYAVFEAGESGSALDAAIRWEKEALTAWEGLVETVCGVYADALGMGRPQASLSGHWRDEIGPLRQGIEALEARYAELAESEEADELREVPLTPGPDVEHTRTTRLDCGSDLVVVARVTHPAGVGSVKLRHRAVNQMLDFGERDMVPTGESVYEAVIPGSAIDPAYDHMYLIEAIACDGTGRIWPDLEVETPYVIVEGVR